MGMMIIRAAALGFLALMAGCSVVDTLTPSTSALQLGYPKIPTDVSRLPLPAVALRSDGSAPAKPTPGAPSTLPALNAVTLGSAILPVDDNASQADYEDASDTSGFADMLKPLSDVEREKMFMDLAAQGKGHRTPPPPVINLQDVSMAMADSASENVLVP
jgi:hypothetical protein